MSETATGVIRFDGGDGGDRSGKNILGKLRMELRASLARAR